MQLPEPLMAGLRPRCIVCHRRLRSVPWKDLMIGPICARKNPALLRTLRGVFVRAEREAEFERLLHTAGLTSDE